MYLNKQEKRDGMQTQSFRKRERERGAVKWRVGQRLRQSTALLYQQFKHVLD